MRYKRSDEKEMLKKHIHLLEEKYSYNLNLVDWKLHHFIDTYYKVNYLSIKLSHLFWFVCVDL